MSTDQKIFTNALEELANDLHAQQQLQIEDLKAEHKKKEAALLEKIQTAETRYQELESKYQKDVNSLKSKSAKGLAESHHDQDAATVSDNKRSQIF